MALSKEAYHLRTGRSKRLQEELYPLSRFALKLVYPGMSVQVEAFENDGPMDGLFGLMMEFQLTLYEKGMDYKELLYLL